jgi:phage tail-like protein
MAGNDLISTDPLIARNFALQIDGDIISLLSGVSGLDLEVEVVALQQNGVGGKQQHIKTLGGHIKAPDLSLTRMAPIDAMADPLWKWFLEVRNSGIKAADRTNNRKNGSVVIYDSAYSELARFNFTNGWPSKIATDALSTDSNDAVKETITLVCERIDRVK